MDIEDSTFTTEGVAQCPDCSHTLGNPVSYRKQNDGFCVHYSCRRCRAEVKIFLSVFPVEALEWLYTYAARIDEAIEHKGKGSPRYEELRDGIENELNDRGEEAPNVWPEMAVRMRKHKISNIDTEFPGLFTVAFTPDDVNVDEYPPGEHPMVTRVTQTEADELVSEHGASKE